VDFCSMRFARRWPAACPPTRSGLSPGWATAWLTPSSRSTVSWSSGRCRS